MSVLSHDRPASQSSSLTGGKARKNQTAAGPLEIPALYILNRLFPLYGLAYAQFCAELILSAAAVVVLARLFRRLEKEKAAGTLRREDMD